MTSSVIKIENLNFYYDYKLLNQMHALKDIALDMNAGDYIVFFGPSGCGKTTLIYLIGGIISIGQSEVTGKIFVNDRDVLELSRDDLALFRQTSIGIIFQNFNLIPSLTVLDNVALPMSFVGVPQKKRAAEAEMLLARLGMETYAHRYPSELSGGQQQRVGIARALANNPPIIIADEPLGNLDSENAEHVLAFLKELQTKDGRTIIMVTHEAWSVRDAGKIIYLKDGAIVKVSRNAREEIAAQAETVHVAPNILRTLYPDLTTDELAVKSLSNLLMRGFSADEMQRFEQYLGKRLSGAMDALSFEASLDLPYRKGGVGLWRQTAHKVAALIEDIIVEQKRLESVHAKLAVNPNAPIQNEIALLRSWLLTVYHGAMDEVQCARLDELIKERLRDAVSIEEFRARANLSRLKGGIGLSMRAAQHISDRFEAVLAPKHAKAAGVPASTLSVVRLLP